MTNNQYVDTSATAGGNGGDDFANANEFGKNDIDVPPPEEADYQLDAPEYMTDDFRMHRFKIEPCSKRFSHDWTTCPFAHPGEKARRRDPKECKYAAIACIDMKNTGYCPRGEDCPYAHNVFEYWMHPTRYRTQICNDGSNCKRKICFFAHALEELRVPPHKPGFPPEWHKGKRHNRSKSMGTSTSPRKSRSGPPKSPFLSRTSSVPVDVKLDDKVVSQADIQVQQANSFPGAFSVPEHLVSPASTNGSETHWDFDPSSPYAATRTYTPRQSPNASVTRILSPRMTIPENEEVSPVHVSDANVNYLIRQFEAMPLAGQQLAHAHLSANLLDSLPPEIMLVGSPGAAGYYYPTSAPDTPTGQPVDPSGLDMTTGYPADVFPGNLLMAKMQGAGVGGGGAASALARYAYTVPYGAVKVPRECAPFPMMGSDAGSPITPPGANFFSNYAADGSPGMIDPVARQAVVKTDGEMMAGAAGGYGYPVDLGFAL